MDIALDWTAIVVAIIGLLSGGGFMKWWTSRSEKRFNDAKAWETLVVQQQDQINKLIERVNEYEIRLSDKDAKIAALEAENDAKEKRIDALEEKIRLLEARRR